MARRSGTSWLLLALLAVACRASEPQLAQDLASTARPAMAINALAQLERALEVWSEARESGASGPELEQALERAEHALDRGLVISPGEAALLARRGQVRFERAELAESAARREELRRAGVADLRQALTAEPWFVPAHLALADHLTQTAKFGEARATLDQALHALLALAGQRNAPRGFWQALSDGFFGVDPRANAARDAHVARASESIAVDEAWRLDASSAAVATPAAMPRGENAAVDVARYRGLLWIARAQLEFRERTFARAPTESELRDLLTQLERARDLHPNLLEADLAKAALHAQLRQSLQAVALLEPYLDERFPRIANDWRWVLTSACWRVDLYLELGRDDDRRAALERLDAAIEAGADTVVLRRARALAHLAHAERSGSASALARAERDLEHLRSRAEPPADIAQLCAAAESLRSKLTASR